MSKLHGFSPFARRYSIAFIMPLQRQKPILSLREPAYKKVFHL